MTDEFFKRPILNSPYSHPAQHWELDPDGQPTNVIVDARRHSDLITPVPKPRKRRRSQDQAEMVLDSGDDLSSAEQEYNPTPIINEIGDMLTPGVPSPIQISGRSRRKRHAYSSTGATMISRTYGRFSARWRRSKPPSG